MIHADQLPTAKRRQKKPTAKLPIEGKGTVHSTSRVDRETLQARCDCLNHQVRILMRLAVMAGLTVEVGGWGVRIQETGETE
jgi:hypothetical protein